MALKRKHHASVADGDVEQSQTKVSVNDMKALAKEALEKKTKITNITTLLKELEKPQPKTKFAAATALTYVFEKLIVRGDLHKSSKDQDNEVKLQVTSWLRKQLAAFTDLLLAQLVHDTEPALQIAAWNSLLTLQKAESIALSQIQKATAFENKTFTTVVEVLISNKNVSPKLLEKVVEMANEYDDIRLYFFRNVAKACGAESSKKKVQDDTVYTLLSGLNNIADEKDLTGTNWVPPPSETKKRKTTDSEESDLDSQPDSLQRKAFTDCWLAFLRGVPLSQAIYKRILLIMHQRILPFLTRPTELIDFLTDSYNIGGSTSLLALNGLFTLIQEHNLDYPLFYPKLYALLTPTLLHTKYRSRFFRLLELFLSSKYLASQLVASFIKRLCRMCLTGPVGGIVGVLPFIYNLFRLHPGCIQMIHRAEVGSDPVKDPFDDSETDPMKTKAIESSLWELHTISTHFHSSVSGLARVFSEPLSKPAYNLEDFMDHTYDVLFEYEAKEDKEVKELSVAGQMGTGELIPLVI
ncbi:hypothetical protein HDV05_007096 [Chytridiales sp. JEL 0842]|nr:hypothetical protein HDV05_007096 [Chytridiales sp. JEL 0842]